MTGESFVDAAETESLTGSSFVDIEKSVSKWIGGSIEDFSNTRSQKAFKER